jgi:hypothetical protein
MLLHEKDALRDPRRLGFRVVHGLPQGPVRLPARERERVPREEALIEVDDEDVKARHAMEVRIRAVDYRE